MKNFKKYPFLLILISSLSAFGIMSSACGGSAAEAIDQSIRQAEDALARGDMQVAESVSSKILGTGNETGLTATQLARLSMVYMQLADGTRNSDYTGRANDLYKKAYDVDADSAARYYNNVRADLQQHVELLSKLNAPEGKNIYPYTEHDYIPGESDSLPSDVILSE